MEGGAVLIPEQKTAFRKLPLKRFPKEGLRRTPEAQYWRRFKVSCPSGSTPSLHSIKFPILLNENATPTCVDFAPVSPHDFAITGGVRVRASWRVRAHRLRVRT